jgi:hypothetical protein
MKSFLINKHLHYKKVTKNKNKHILNVKRNFKMALFILSKGLTKEFFFLKED